MSIAARQALDRHATPWLFGTALASTAPHFLHQPLWLSALSGVAITWAIWLWHEDRRLPGRWVLVLLVAAGCAGIFAEFRTLFGRDAGVAMLVAFMAMKLLELRSKRDATVVVTLAYFLLLTHYFYSQSLPTGFWLLACMGLATATLLRLHGGNYCSPQVIFRLAGLLCLQAFPFMLVLFMLFPRISGPLWGLPADAYAGMTGLSETMSPGSISRLAQSGEIAFRVRFDDKLPARQQLYWRGPVMEDFDGLTWQPANEQGTAPQLDRLSPAIAYETTLEAHNQRWLLALDAPRDLPAETSPNSRLTVESRNTVSARQRFRLSASLDYRFNANESAKVIRRNLSLPKGVNPRSTALARQWQRLEKTPEDIVGKALALFGAEFTYTLQPPLLGPDGVDDFLFQTRRGFCEHYAAAFVVLMRAAGIPARVVGGYQGGEYNPLDGTLVVRQSDAHAWAEIWLEEKGWQRVDPTAAVSPARIETGIASALPEDEPLPVLVQWRADWVRGLRYRWEAINNTWNQYVLGYDSNRQRQLFARFGWPDTDWQTYATMLGITSGILVAALLIWAIRPQHESDPALQLWQKALRHLARRQVDCAPWETPMALLQRVDMNHPELADPLRKVVEAYLHTRYGSTPNHLKNLRDAVALLR